MANLYDMMVDDSGATASPKQWVLVLLEMLSENFPVGNAMKAEQ